MSPERFYWIVLLFLVMPSLPFNKVAIAVAIVWAFGHLAHVMGPYEDMACMAARIVALGAALSLSKPWDGSRGAYARMFTAALFAPAALLSMYASLYVTGPPASWAEYEWQTRLYWSTYTLIMMQAVSVPFGNDWSKALDMLKRIDSWIMSKIVKYFEQVL